MIFFNAEHVQRKCVGKFKKKKKKKEKSNRKVSGRLTA